MGPRHNTPEPGKAEAGARYSAATQLQTAQVSRPDEQVNGFIARDFRQRGRAQNKPVQVLTQSRSGPTDRRSVRASVRRSERARIAEQGDGQEIYVYINK